MGVFTDSVVSPRAVVNEVDEEVVNVVVVVLVEEVVVNDEVDIVVSGVLPYGIRSHIVSLPENTDGSKLSINSLISLSSIYIPYLL